ncbi:MAG: S10 family peptidase [Candidatus Aminicenantales bacterium]
MISSLIKRHSRLFFLLTLSLGCLSLSAQQERPRDPALVQAPSRAAAPAEKAAVDYPEENVSTTTHTIIVGGKPLAYTAVAGTLLLKADDGRPRANVYFTAYFRSDVKDKALRPMSFVYNGGPGTSSIWVHMGAFGPRKVQLADDGNSLPGPFRLIDNENTLLDVTDLCFIDPVSTGYSRPVPGEKPEQFHGYVEDIASVGDFIRLFVTRYERWASPKFLIGESYGTTRSAGLSGYLQSGSNGMYLHGIVLISSVLNFGTIRFAPMNDLPCISFLPTYTADAWYHKKLPQDLLAKDLPAVLDEARSFAEGEYASALMKGNALDPARKSAVVRSLARYTGLSPEYIEDSNLRISLQRFVKELLRDERKTIGRLDGRFTGFDADAAGEGYEYDPSNAAIYGPFPATLNAYLRTELKYKNDTPYAVSGNVRPWNYDNVQNQYLNTAETLRSAMSSNQYLKVFVANGYYDGATPFFGTEYTFRHMDLGGELTSRVKFGYYEAGHMMYIRKAEHAKLKADLAEFIRTAAAVEQ